MITSGTVQWCSTCGCFAESRATERMQQACPGPPPQSAGSGGMKQQLMRLRAGLHPVTGDRLPVAIDSDGKVLSGSGLYSRLTPSPAEGVSTDPNFSPYVPCTFANAVPQVGRSAQDKKKLMLAKVRAKPAKEARRRKRLRKSEARTDLNTLIDSFVADPSGPERQPASEVNSDEEFWNNLPVDETRHGWVRNIPSPPAHDFHGKIVKSRTKQPVVHRRAEHSRRCTGLTCFEFGCDGGHSL